MNIFLLIPWYPLIIMLPSPIADLFIVVTHDTQDREDYLYRPQYLVSQTPTCYKVQAESFGISVYRAPLDCSSLVRVKGKTNFRAIRGVDGLVDPQIHMDLYESWGDEENLCYHALLSFDKTHYVVCIKGPKFTKVPTNVVDLGRPVTFSDITILTVTTLLKLPFLITDLFKIALLNIEAHKSEPESKVTNPLVVSSDLLAQIKGGVKLQPVANPQPFISVKSFFDIIREGIILKHVVKPEEVSKESMDSEFGVFNRAMKLVNMKVLESKLAILEVQFKLQDENFLTTEDSDWN